MKNKVDYYNKNGFVILKNIINKKVVKNLFNEIEIIKKKLSRQKIKDFFILLQITRLALFTTFKNSTNQKHFQLYRKIQN